MLISKCGHIIALLFMVLAITIDSARSDHDNCKGELDFINLLMDMCVAVKFGARDDHDNCLGSIEPFEMYICNDRKYSFTIDRIHQLNPQAIFSLSYCIPYCIITTNVSSTCHFYNDTMTEYNLRNRELITNLPYPMHPPLNDSC
jgi:hypothetical protein